MQCVQCVSKSCGQELNGESCAALQNFEAAAQLVPTDKLSSKIAQMGVRPVVETPIAEKKASPKLYRNYTGIGGKEIRDVLETRILVALNSGNDERVSALKDIGPKRQVKV